MLLLHQQFSREMLQDIPSTMCYTNNIILTGEMEEKHLENLWMTLKPLHQCGTCAKLAKCKFMESEVEYLDHRIDKEALVYSKLKAITEAPPPKNVQEPHSFLPIYTPNLASIIHPLNQLLHKSVKWKWSKECDQSLRLAKEKLINFWVRKFLFGKRFTLLWSWTISLSLAFWAVAIPVMVAARLQQWAVILSAYCLQYRISPHWTAC